jgi:MFS family permease
VASSVAAADEPNVISSHRLVIFAASLGAIIEWYDFYLYATLAALIAKAFFSGVSEPFSFIFALLVLAAGFVVRPFGALVFGRLGDSTGRKRTFLITIVVMSLATGLVGLLPGYAQLGLTAPVALVALRLLQGLAIGGEYGGAATYVAEHAPPGKRGFYTSWIQTTAGLGQVISLVVILICQNSMGERFAVWGWRIPFLLSFVLLTFSVYIRLKLQESPVFQQMLAEGRASKAPLRETLSEPGNMKLIVFVMLGAVAGQAVVSYTAQFYSLFFMTQVLKVAQQSANLLIMLALTLSTPFMVLFGWLSDKIGRKPLILGACVLAICTYIPIFHAITHYANPAIEQAAKSSPVTVVADPAGCSFQFDPLGRAKFTSACDIAKRALAKAGAPYKSLPGVPDAGVVVRIGSQSLDSFEGSHLAAADFAARSAAFDKALGAGLKAAGYPTTADPARINYPMLLLFLFIPLVFSAMAYAPLAAWLVELFPAKIRYTSMSLPYHLGNGWVGGLLPTVAFGIVAATGDIYAGLWYTLVFAALAILIGGIFLREGSKPSWSRR